MRVATLHQLNDLATRTAVKDAQLVILVDPHTGRQNVIGGAAFVEAARPSGDAEAGAWAVSISVEVESHELELAVAAVLAIRGAIDDAKAAEQLRPLAATILKYWNNGLDVPWSEMLLG
jgi:hypothetical protein